jgi:perosamine synthetase
LGAFLATDSSRIFLFRKGRVALYALLKALGVKQGDEVILPAFTCVVVPNAIVYAGAKPVYVDIEPNTYNIDVSKISVKITGRTKIILAQNTFGLSPDMNAVMEIAIQNGLMVVEDCAHGFGGMYKGKQNGMLADASFYSSQWNKPFSTGIGGMCVVRDKNLAEKVHAIEAQAATPSRMQEMKLKALLYIRKNMPPSMYWNALRYYRWMSSAGIVPGSSSKQELEDVRMPVDFLTGMSHVQATEGIAQMKRIDELNAQRLATATRYSEFLSGLNVQPVFVPSYAKHIFLKYPLLVHHRDKFLLAAKKEKVEIGDWFLSPLHPIEENLARWLYTYGENPVAERISRHIVNLPTHEKIDEKELRRIFAFLKKYSELLMK